MEKSNNSLLAEALKRESRNGERFYLGFYNNENAVTAWSGVIGDNYITYDELTIKQVLNFIVNNTIPIIERQAIKLILLTKGAEIEKDIGKKISEILDNKQFLLCSFILDNSEKPHIVILILPDFPPDDGKLRPDKILKESDLANLIKEMFI